MTTLALSLVSLLVDNVRLLRPRRESLMQMDRFWQTAAPRLSLVTWLIGCSLAAGADAGPTTTAPASLDGRQLAGLIEIAHRLNLRRWGPPVVVTFEKAPPKTQWKVQGGKVQFKNNQMIVDAGGKPGLIWALRSLPPAVRKGDGIRIDAWVQAQPMIRRGGAKRVDFFYLGLFLSTHNLRPMQWDYNYLFAVSRDGVIHQFQAVNTGVILSGAVDRFKADRLTHVRMELIRQQVHCQRDNSRPLTRDDPRILPLKLGDESVVGLMGQSSRIHVAKMVFRVLEPKIEESALADQWKKTPFPDKEALTRYLAERVIPQLDSRRFRTRHRAADLLRSLWPLSRPAMQTAAENLSRFSAEGQLRLKALLVYLPPVSVPVTQPDDETAGPPPKANKTPPATQPERPAPSAPAVAPRRARIPARSR